MTSRTRGPRRGTPIPVLAALALLGTACNPGTGAGAGTGVEGFSPLRHVAPRGTIVVVVEGLGPDQLSDLGPLADLVGEGIVFSNAYGSTSAAGPARASLAEGDWPRRHGAGEAPADLGGTALARALGEHGCAITRHAADSAPADWVPAQGDYCAWAELEDVDRAGVALRELFAHLEARGERDDTYVWLVGVPAPTSVTLQPDPLPRVGLAVWREGHVAPGEVRPQLVGTLDVFATIVHLAGTDALGEAADVAAASPDDEPGTSFGRLLLQQPQAWRGWVIGETPDGKGRAIIRGGHRLWRAASGQFGLFELDGGGPNLVGRPEVALVEEELRTLLGR